MIENLPLDLKKNQRNKCRQKLSRVTRNFHQGKKSSPYHLVCSVHFLPPPLPHPFITKYDSFILNLHRVIFQYHSGSTTNPTSSSPKSAKQHPVWRQKHMTMSTEPKS